MRYIVRKYIDADTVAEAITKEAGTPIHDVYLKEGEEPKRNDTPKDLIGFVDNQVIGYYDAEIIAGKKR